MDDLGREWHITGFLNLAAVVSATDLRGVTYKPRNGTTSPTCWATSPAIPAFSHWSPRAAPAWKDCASPKLRTPWGLAAGLRRKQAFTPAAHTSGKDHIRCSTARLTGAPATSPDVPLPRPRPALSASSKPLAGYQVIMTPANDPCKRALNSGLSAASPTSARLIFVSGMHPVSRAL